MLIIQIWLIASDRKLLKSNEQNMQIYTVTGLNAHMVLDN